MRMGSEGNTPRKIGSDMSNRDQMNRSPNRIPQGYTQTQPRNKKEGGDYGSYTRKFKSP